MNCWRVVDQWIGHPEDRTDSSVCLPIPIVSDSEIEPSHSLEPRVFVPKVNCQPFWFNLQNQQSSGAGLSRELLVLFEVDASVGSRDSLSVNNFGLLHPIGIADLIESQLAMNYSSSSSYHLSLCESEIDLPSALQSPNLENARNNSPNGLLVPPFGRGDAGTESLAGTTLGKSSLSDWRGCSPFKVDVLSSTSVI